MSFTLSYKHPLGMGKRKTYISDYGSGWTKQSQNTGIESISYVCGSALTLFLNPSVGKKVIIQVPADFWVLTRL